MSTAEANELTDVMERVKTWPATLRIALAHRILDSLQVPEAPTTPPKTRGYSADQARGLLKTDRPPPTDEECDRILEEELMKKYGS